MNEKVRESRKFTLIIDLSEASGRAVSSNEDIQSLGPPCPLIFKSL